MISRATGPVKSAFILTWFAGINVGDSLTHYLPRSVRFAQYGTFGIDLTYYDFMQYFHQALVAVELVFLHSDVLVNVGSFAAVCAIASVVNRQANTPDNRTTAYRIADFTRLP